MVLGRTIAFFALLFAFDVQAYQRSYVATYGSDNNHVTGCTQDAPCRTFTIGMTQVNPGGELLVLDTGEFGNLGITKPVTVIANPGVHAVAIGVAITNGIHATVRGLQVVGSGTFGTGRGFSVNGASLDIENCVVSGWGDGGLWLQASQVRIVDTIVRNNFGSGMYIRDSGTVSLRNVRVFGNEGGLQIETGLVAAPTIVTVTESEVSSNGWGILVYKGAFDEEIRVSIQGTVVANNTGFGISVSGPKSRLAIGSSSIVGNAYGFSNQGGGAVFESYGDNILRYNATQTVGTITPVSGQ